MEGISRLRLTCVRCGGSDLQLDGWVEAKLLCRFREKLNDAVERSPLDIHYASFELGDARITCAGCQGEAGANCRNEETQVSIELALPRLNEVLRKTLSTKGFRFNQWNAELDWRPDFDHALREEYPVLREA